MYGGCNLLNQGQNFQRKEYDPKGWRNINQQKKLGAGSKRATCKREKSTNSSKETNLATSYLIATAPKWEHLISHLQNHPTMED
jgi:hypothetical protein